VTGLRHLVAGLAVLRSRLALPFWSLLACLRLRAAGAVVGPGLRVRGWVRLHCHRTGAIRIGRDCRIQSGFGGNPVGGDSRMAIWVGPSGRLTVGDRVGLSNSTIVCMRSVLIEDEVFLGGGSRVYDTDFHSLDPAERARPGNPGVRTAPVAVRRRAFVGGHVVLLKGVTVGEAAVVGAGSVVRSDVPGGEVWAGNPAGLVRRLRTARSPREGSRPAASAVVT
jgi:acetyltransferase-like isoleucine patch superfamily enzyme